MSQANVDVSRQSAEAFLRGDWDALAASFDPNIFLRLDSRWPEPTFSGRESALEFLRSTQELSGPRGGRIEEVKPIGDRVLVRWHWDTRGEHSRAEGVLRWSQIDTVRKGQIIFIEYFLDHEAALKAVGLEE